MSNIQSRKLILLDTDIGSDVDDSLALAYLLKQPHADLIGVTTVSGEAHLRASIVDAIAQQIGSHDIPIHVGVQEPLLTTQLQPRAPHYDVIARDNAALFQHRDFRPRPTAIEFLRDTIRANPGEVTLLAIGPLTNIALLFKLDPEIPSLLERLVIMGAQITGWAKTGQTLAEWNIRCDPHAAAVVFASDAPLTAVGLEITTQCRLTASECREKLTAPSVPSILMPMAAHWLGHQEYVTFHDPLAAALIFEPSLCNLVRGTIDVETTSAKASGMTYWEKNSESGPHLGASSVDSDAFFAHYFEILSS